MDKSKELNNLKSDINTKKLMEISTKIGKLDTKLWIVIILLAGALIIAIADL